MKSLLQSGGVVSFRLSDGPLRMRSFHGPARDFDPLGRSPWAPLTGAGFRPSGPEPLGAFVTAYRAST
jgi:hypothetical protein